MQLTVPATPDDGRGRLVEVAIPSTNNNDMLENCKRIAEWELGYYGAMISSSIPTQRLQTLWLRNRPPAIDAFQLCVNRDHGHAHTFQCLPGY